MSKNGFVLPFGPVNHQDSVIDTYYYEDVNESHCVGQVSQNICRHLLEVSQLEGKKFLPVCCPAYNEEVDEMEKTVMSMLESFNFMKNKVLLLFVFFLIFDSLHFSFYIHIFCFLSFMSNFSLLSASLPDFSLLTYTFLDQRHHRV
jgi:hypothetical protein